MRHQHFTTLLVLLTSGCLHLAAQTTEHFEVYGQLQQDYGRGYDILNLPDGTYVLGGEFNKKAFLMKVNAAGEQLAFRQLDQEFVGNSRFNQLTTNGLDDVIAVGECDHCNGADTLHKVIVARVNSTSLQTLASKKLGGTDPALNRAFNAHVVRTANGQLALLSAVSNGNTLNFEDLLLRGLHPNSLEVQWERQFNSCGNCGFEYVLAATATNSGFSTLLEHAFGDSITFYHFDQTGQTLWKQRFFREGGTTSAGMAFRNEKIYFGSQGYGSLNDPAHTAILLARADATTGQVETGLLLNDSLINESLHDLSFTSNGTLLAAYRRAEPNPFGTYAVSRVYRIDPETMQVIDYVQLPNPNNITSILIHAVAPASADGSTLVATGSYGLNYRPFFYSTATVSGVSNASPTDEVAVWPNPGNGVFSVALGAWADEATEVEVCDPLGRVLRQWKNATQTVLQIDLGTQQSGLYYLRLRNGERSLTQKLVVQ